MRISTLGAGVGFSLQICSGTAALIWPEAIWVAKASFVLSLVLLAAWLFWFAVSNLRRGKAKRRIPLRDAMGLTVTTSAIGLGAFVGWLLYSNVEGTPGALARRIDELKKGVDVNLDIAAPKWSQQSDGTWHVEGDIHVTSKYLRTGLLIGATADSIQEILVAPLTGQSIRGGGYTRREDLGTQRIYVGDARAMYRLVVILKQKSPITIRYVFEGEPDGPPTTWHPPEKTKLGSE